jgi:hypothetical protein
MTAFRGPSSIMPHGHTITAFYRRAGTMSRSEVGADRQLPERGPASRRLTVSPSHRLTVSPSHRLTVSPSRRPTAPPSSSMPFCPDACLVDGPGRAWRAWRAGDAKSMARAARGVSSTINGNCYFHRQAPRSAPPLSIQNMRMSEGE